MPEQRDPLLYLDDIIEACQKIQTYVEKAESDDFTENKMIVDAVIRNLEVIGEAVGNIPVPIRQKSSLVDWKRIKALRNVLAHEYFGVDLEIIADLVNNKVPELEKDIQQLQQKLEVDRE